MLAAAFLCRLTAGVAVFEALFTAASGAAAVFFSWAIGREIDPAHDWSAFAALPFTIFAFFSLGSPALLALFFILLFSRALNGSTGLRCTLFDALLLLVIGALLFSYGFLSGIPILAAVFLLDAVLEPAHRSQKYFALLSLALFAALVAVYGGEHHPVAPAVDLYGTLSALVVAAAALLLLVRTRGAGAVDDTSGLPLDRWRIFSVKLLVAIFVAAELFLNGRNGLVMLYPAGFAFIGTALFHLTGLLKNRRRS